MLIETPVMPCANRAVGMTSAGKGQEVRKGNGREGKWRCGADMKCEGTFNEERNQYSKVRKRSIEGR
jgi:hypothetical protein